MTLLEKYSKRTAVAEGLYKKTHDGNSMPLNTKLTLAKCLQNTDKFLTEAFENSVGTNRADMGLFKKFCLNLTNVTLN